MTQAVVVGAGIGGLTTAAALAKAGLEVTVLEAHIYPGGCAGTFYFQGYRFDAGATLAGGYSPGGPMDRLGQIIGIPSWPARSAEPAMRVHLPDGMTIDRRADAGRWEERRRAFGDEGEPFWRWQESTADVMWDLAMRLPEWPPHSITNLAQLLETIAPWMAHDARWRTAPALLVDALRPVSARLPNRAERLRRFVDAQLLISAQATSERTNALYAASALDLPRRGVVQFQGGMGRIGERLAEAVQLNGGRVAYRKRVTRIVLERGRPVAVELERGDPVPADIVIANLPPANISHLLGDMAPPRLQGAATHPADGWGALTVYVGLENSAIPEDTPLHHQLLSSQGLGEGGSIFLSLSPTWDETRAPKDHRALTISTHTRLAGWWELFESDRPAYEARKQQYLERALGLAERLIPGIRESASLVLPGTPVTFQRYTGRKLGWVGGYPQTSLFRTHPPRLSRNLWMVGDSIFPGQSTAAVALGGLRVAQEVLRSLEERLPAPDYAVAPSARGALR